MVLELKKVTPVELRSVGLNEKWLQDQIQKDPTILGLGDLRIISKEHKQISGGRIDFLMYDGDNTFYEIEVMLGNLDESHFIRTIEYWDLERQRLPNYEHRAVIVAEKITGRFFNVLRLLNRSVPMIAVQLGAFKLDDTFIVLHPVTVLNDVGDEIIDDIEDPSDAAPADRAYWEKNKESLTVVDKIVSAMKTAGIPGDLSYKKADIPLGSTGNNFCWFNPRRAPGYCRIRVKLSPELRDAAIAKLQEHGIDASVRSARSISFSITNKELDGHLGPILEVIKQAEELSR